MTETKLKLEYSVTEESGGIPVIIVAAGNSTRMQGVNKQFVEIAGVPVIARTLLAFENSGHVSEIILVTRQEDILNLELLAEKYGISKLKDIVKGGNSRQESVLNGFAMLRTDTESVLIHDGARPFVSESIICSVVETLSKCDAVTCAVKVKDTIKQIDQNGKVIKTLDRNELVAVQTPQGVKVKKYLEAAEKLGDVSTFTDDTSIMESAGDEVYTVEGSYKNIKITTREDTLAAEKFIDEVEE